MKFVSGQLARVRRFDASRSISGTVAVNFASAAILMVLSIALARILGVSDFGLYVYIASIAGAASSIAALGLPTLITRQVSAWRSTGEWTKLNGIIAFGAGATLISAVVCGLLLYACSGFFGKITSTPRFSVALLLGVGIMAVRSVDLTLAGALQGLHVVARSLIPQSLVVPSGVLGFAWVLHSMHRPVNAVELLTVQLVASVVAESYQIVNLARFRPLLSKGCKIEVHAATWVLSALPFLGTGLLFVINTRIDILLLGFYRGSSSAGIYQVGARAALLVVLSLGAIVTAIQPRIASLHASGDNTGVARIVTNTTRLAFFVALLGGILLYIFGAPIIRVLLGESFITAVPVLQILIIGRLVNAGVGSLSPYLAMTGKERLLMMGVAAEATLNVVLNIILIPRWGLDGAAFASAISLAVVNIFQAVHVYRRWGVDTSILGLRRLAA